jgi:hypothetical protein
LILKRGSYNEVSSAVGAAPAIPAALKQNNIKIENINHYHS